MSKILILVANQANRRLLADLLSPNYDPVVAESDVDLQQQFDLCILDGVMLDRLWDKLIPRKSVEQSVFLPFLLITSRKDVGMASRHLWKTIDELLISPVNKLELQARVESLLCIRRLSFELKKNEDLTVLGRLAGGIGNELRNPLGIINNAVYYLKLIQPDANEKVREYLSILEYEIHRAQTLVIDLLNFATFKAGDRHSTPLSDIVSLAIKDAQISNGIQLLVTVPHKLPPVLVDQDQIKQALINIIQNACQAMPNGGKLTIHGELEHIQNGREVQKWVRLNVKDNGEGIRKENFTKIFDPLFTTRTQGIGLGLTISKKLIELNGGRINFKSEFNKGTVFHIDLPVG